MSHNMSHLQQAQQLALMKIAERCKYDLYYLVKYILAEDESKVTDQTHGELCRYTESLTPHSTRISGVVESQGGELSTVSGAPEKITEELDVHSQVSENTGVIPQLDVHNTQDSFDPRKKFLLLLMPRGTFKSSVVTVGYTLQMILNDPDCRILIDSETFAKSKAFLAAVKGHLQGNDKFREVYHTLYGSYPDAKKRDDLWTDSQIVVSARKLTRKEATVSCGGVDVTKNGMHYDLIIMDDLHSELNTANKEQIEKVKDHFKLALSLIDPGKPIIVIGTRWDYNDVYQYILDYYPEHFNILIRKAYNPDGSLFFPEVLTESELQLRKTVQGSYMFSCQYMNEPVDDETATFKRSMLVRKSWDLVKDRPINWILSVDPSYEGLYSDYTAFVIAGMDHQRDIYVRYVLRAKMTYADIIRTMFELNAEYSPQRILLETVATQKSIQYELNNEQRRRGSWLPVTEIKSRSKSKEERIRGLAPYYEFGHIFHVKECHQLEDLEYELLHFPRGTHDDVIDALASVLEVASPPSGVAVGEKSSKKRRLAALLDKPRSPITGY